MTTTDAIRLRVKRAMAFCPTCKRPSEGGLRAVSRESGVSPATIYRFLRGRNTWSENLDKLEAWVIKQERRSKR